MKRYLPTSVLIAIAAFVLPTLAYAGHRDQGHADHGRIGRSRRIEADEGRVPHREAAQRRRHHPREGDPDRVCELHLRQSHADWLQLATSLPALPGWR